MRLGWRPLTSTPRSGRCNIPNYPTIVAAIEFDRTGTTMVGKYVLNHSFMVPGLIATVGAVAAGLVLVHFV